MCYAYDEHKQSKHRKLTTPVQYSFEEGNPVGINIVDMNDTEVYSINVLLRLLKCQIELMLVEHKHVSPKLFSSGPYGVWYHTMEL